MCWCTILILREQLLTILLLWIWQMLHLCSNRSLGNHLISIAIIIVSKVFFIDYSIKVRSSIDSYNLLISLLNILLRWIELIILRLKVLLKSSHNRILIRKHLLLREDLLSLFIYFIYLVNVIFSSCFSFILFYVD